jgi:hemoglobin
MADSQPTAPRIFSARPELTRSVMDRTGLDPALLDALVQNFYAKIRQDDMLAPVFDSRITQWAPHLERMVSFWCSVALMTGTYHGAPVPAHANLPITRAHFDRWLMLFRETALEVCAPAGASHVIERAERIARSLHMAVEDQARTAHQSVPSLR